MTLEELYKIIQDRKKKMPENSYAASLFKQGKDRIIQKVGEESTEVIIAAKNDDKRKTIEEICDLFFHILVLMAFNDIGPDDLYQELNRRKSNKSLIK